MNKRGGGADDSVSSGDRNKRTGGGFGLFQRRNRKVPDPNPASGAVAMTSGGGDNKDAPPSESVAAKTIPSTSYGSQGKGAALAATPNWLCRTKFFQNLCDTAFEAVDVDQSGSIDQKELYSGLLLIHLNLGTYAGPPACRPLSRAQCLAYFRKMDVDGSGTLDRTEFKHVMAVMFGNVMIRVLGQLSMTIILVPLAAKKVLDLITMLVESAWHVCTFVNEHVVNVPDAFQMVIPSRLLQLADAVQHFLSYIPESVWNSIPLTLISTLLGLVAVPWLLFHIDDFFQSLADRRKGSVY